MGVECLRDCDAACCRATDIIRFDFSADEAQMMRDAGAKMYYLEDGYVIEGGCPFLDGKFCDLHGKPQQPACCRDNVVGGQLCRTIRKLRQRSRYWEVE